MQLLNDKIILRPTVDADRTVIVPARDGLDFCPTKCLAHEGNAGLPQHRDTSSDILAIRLLFEEDIHPEEEGAIGGGGAVYTGIDAALKEPVQLHRCNKRLERENGDANRGEETASRRSPRSRCEAVVALSPETLHEALRASR